MSEPIFERVLHETERLFRHPHPSATITTSSPKGATMDLATIEADARTHVANAMSELAHVAEEVLPKLASAATDAQADPLVQAIESVFLPPDVKQMLAGLVTKLGTPVSGSQTAPETTADAPVTSDAPEAAGAAEAISAPQGPQVAGVA